MSKMTDPNDVMWQLRERAQKLPEGDEMDKMLVQLQVEREKVRAILDALITENSYRMTMIDLAEAVSERFAVLEVSRDSLQDKLDGIFYGSNAEDGYHAFATTYNWQHPDGEPMASWHQLDKATQDAFIAFAKAAWGKP